MLLNPNIFGKLTIQPLFVTVVHWPVQSDVRMSTAVTNLTNSLTWKNKTCLNKPLLTMIRLLSFCLQACCRHRIKIGAFESIWCLLKCMHTLTTQSSIGKIHKEKNPHKKQTDFYLAVREYLFQTLIAAEKWCAAKLNILPCYEMQSKVLFGVCL